MWFSASWVEQLLKIKFQIHEYKILQSLILYKKNPFNISITKICLYQNAYNGQFTLQKYLSGEQIDGQS